MLKGADPVYQLDLRADPPCIKSKRPGTSQPLPLERLLQRREAGFYGNTVFIGFNHGWKVMLFHGKIMDASLVHEFPCCFINISLLSNNRAHAC